MRGDSIEIFPAYAEQAIRIELWGDVVERITWIDPLTGDLRGAYLLPPVALISSGPTARGAMS